MLLSYNPHIAKHTLVIADEFVGKRNALIMGSQVLVQARDLFVYRADAFGETRTSTLCT